MQIKGVKGFLDNPLLRGTKGRILRLLRGRERTAAEIATALDVTPNGARFHLTELERDGFVTLRSIRRGPRKPSHGYTLTEWGEAHFPKRYDALLNAVLHDVRAGRDSAAVEAMFRRLGRQLAAEQAHRFTGLSTEQRVEEALAFIEELGGAAEVVAGSDHARVARIEGQSCPFGAVVPQHPEACALLESFLQEVLPGMAVCEMCQKDPAESAPRCRFEVRLSAQA